MAALNNLGLGTDANLQGYWKLSDLTDETANGYDLTNNGSAAFVAGKFGNAADLESTSSQYLSIADASCANLEISGSQTWSFWVKPESITASHIVMSKDNSATKQIFILSTGKIRTRFDGLSTTTLDSDEILSTGQWYHVAFVFNDAANTTQVWVNGVKKEGASITGTTTDTNGDFRIGANNTGNYFDGLVDDACVFDRALTETEILSISHPLTPKVTFII